MSYVALVTLLLLLQYMVFCMMAGLARGKAGIKAPAMTGDENFERNLRVQMNTLEQLVVTLPLMWVCAYFFRPDVAAIAGSVFFVGRVLYGLAYVADPSKRALGMMLGFFSNVAMLLASFYAVVMTLV